jgi:hypothetical protein
VEALDASADERVEDVFENRPVGGREHRFRAVARQRPQSGSFTRGQNDGGTNCHA